MFRTFLYGVVVLAYAVAGTHDLFNGDLKMGVVACLFAVVNGVIFFWR
jgi:hypothetical protein